MLSPPGYGGGGTTPGLSFRARFFFSFFIDITLDGGLCGLGGARLSHDEKAKRKSSNIAFRS